MKCILSAILLFFTTGKVYSNNSDTSIFHLNESTTIEYLSGDIMMLSYRDVNDVKSKSFGYDIYFRKGKMDSIVYYQDTIELKILYRKPIDHKWEVKIGECENCIYPSDYNRLASYSHMAIEGQDIYQFTMQFDVHDEAIKYIEQRLTIAPGKQVGIILTFKKGRTRFMNIMSSTDRASPTIYFNRRGKIMKMYVLDFIDQRTGLSMYKKFKYAHGKMRSL
ncbi:MAG: hypothetical protein R2809_07600 [Flavobacteriales bacterium]